jgi:circadian clock protein KaiC
MLEPRAIARVTTGVPGLDTVLSGGLFKGGVYIIEGNPGAGKTTLGNQICFHRAADGDSTIYITLLAEAHTRMISHMREMTFFRPDLIPSRIYYISAFKVLEQTGLDGLLKTLSEAVMQRKAQFLVLDGLVSAEEFSSSPREYKKFIHELQTISGMMGVTVLLLSSTERPAAFRPEHTMVDGLISLDDTVQGMRSLRNLVVKKMRGAAQLGGRHAFEISNAGVRVYPRVETRAHRVLEVAAPDASVPFDVTGLDAMLGGGLPAASNTIVTGPTGGGKTMLGLQFLAAGARRNETGLYVGFYERPAGVLAKSERLGFGLRAAVESGGVHIQWEAPVEGVVDAVIERVLESVDKHGAKRLCFDGLHGFRHRAEYPERIRPVFSALSDELTRRGVTSVYTLESRELIGPQIELPIDGVSALAENLILMRHVEIRSDVSRLISVIKVRDRAHDGAIRKLEITDRGLAVGDRFEHAEQVLTGTAHSVSEPP